MVVKKILFILVGIILLQCVHADDFYGAQSDLIPMTSSCQSPGINCYPSGACSNFNYITGCTDTGNNICKAYNSNVNYQATTCRWFTDGELTFLGHPGIDNCRKRTGQYVLFPWPPHWQWNAWQDYPKSDNRIGSWEVECTPDCSSSQPYFNGVSGASYVDVKCQPACAPSWSPWSSCSGCSPSCGSSCTGSQTRSDGCGSIQTQSCTIYGSACPVCTPGAWSNCGGCSPSCGSSCTGTQSQTDSCGVVHSQSCTVYDSACPICYPGSWSACSGCSPSACSSCTGTQSQTDACGIPHSQSCTIPALGGTPTPWSACSGCSPSACSSCTGTQSQTDSCGIPHSQSCTIPALGGTWSSWEACDCTPTPTSGCTGLQKRTNSCGNIETKTCSLPPDCGDKNEVCCTGSSCNAANLICKSGTCTTCGNGKLDSSEKCDGSLYATGENCAKYDPNKPEGYLSCNSDCTINDDNCKATTCITENSLKQQIQICSDYSTLLPLADAKGPRGCECKPYSIQVAQQSAQLIPNFIISTAKCVWNKDKNICELNGTQTTTKGDASCKIEYTYQSSCSENQAFRKVEYHSIQVGTPSPGGDPCSCDSTKTSMDPASDNCVAEIPCPRVVSLSFFSWGNIFATAGIIFAMYVGYALLKKRKKVGKKHANTPSPSKRTKRKK